MKTILVATDFSASADNASRYAVNIAKYLKSNLILCHALPASGDSVVTKNMAGSQGDYEMLLDDASERLDELAKSLMQDGKLLNFPNTFKPLVEYFTEPSYTIHLMEKMGVETNAGLVISGMSGAGAVAKFFAGSTSKGLIESSSFPVLLVPSGYTFKPIKKIAFATSLDGRDIDVIHSLVGFASYFNAELVVVYVGQGSGKYDSKKTNVFLNEITCKINYDKIYYREITSNNINEGLEWLSEHGWIDLLVMVHRKAGIVDRLLKGSLTKKQANHIKIPLLVLPEELTPVF